MRPRFGVLLAVAAFAVGGPVRALEPPPDLPRYDLDITLDTNAHTVQVRERVTWTNRHQRPANGTGLQRLSALSDRQGRHPAPGQDGRATPPGPRRPPWIPSATPAT